jgi:hypothetical protein
MLFFPVPYNPALGLGRRHVFLGQTLERPAGLAWLVPSGAGPPRGRFEGEALDVHFVWLRDGVGPQWRRIPVVGYVGAGEQFHAVDDLSQGAGLDSVDFDLGGVDPIAIEVRGESMLPVYRPGDRLLCSRLAGSDESGFLSKDCVVKLTSGAGYVKRVVRGSKPRHYTLLSYAAEPIADVALEWAAPILWIKRAV